MEKEHLFLTSLTRLIPVPRSGDQLGNVTRQRSELRRWSMALLYGVLFLTWVTLRLQPILASAPFETPDTPGYRLIAERPLSSIHFFVGIRPFTVPLLHKLARTNTMIVVWQSILGLLSWGLLASAAASAVRRSWLRVIACASILAFSLSEPIARWDFLLMSESISLSLLALFVACWLWLSAGWHPRKVLSLLLVAFFWGFTRDTNAYALAMCAALLILITFVRRQQPRYLGLATLLLVIFMTVNMTADLSGRWVFPFLNVIAGQVLPNTEFTTALALRGMPISPTLLRFSGQRAYSEEYGLYNNPALAGFREWLFADGKRAYIHFLLTHPRWAITAPFHDRDALLGLSQADDGFPRSTTRPQQWAGALLYTNRPEAFLGWLAAAVCVACTALWRGYSTPTAAWYVPLGLLLFAWPLGMITWHGDTMDVGRHALQVGVQVRLGILLLILFATDRLAGLRPWSRRA